MNMKIHRGSTSCNCVAGASTGNGNCGCGCGCGGSGGNCGGCNNGWGNGNCGCNHCNNCWDDCGGGGGSVLGEVASETCTENFSIGCGCPIPFCDNSSESGFAVSHVSGSSDFIIREGGRFEITYTIQITGYTYDSAEFELCGHPTSKLQVVVGSDGTGTATGTVVLTLKAGNILRLAPVACMYSAGIEVTFASIYIRRISL